MKTEYESGKGKIELVQGSITGYHADALVCPANSDLDMFAIATGVQCAFLKDGGMEIFSEAEKIGDKLREVKLPNKPPMTAPETSAHLTGAGLLPAKHVIHSVSVAYNPQTGRVYCDADVVGRSVRNALDLARENDLTSIGFPALGTGLYDVPLDEAVRAMAQEFTRHLDGQTTIERIGLVFYFPEKYSEGKQTLNSFFFSN
jgi:O-acetyl-ADP-ribose deacetylase (regulator of RNase III)